MEKLENVSLNPLGDSRQRLDIKVTGGGVMIEFKEGEDALVIASLLKTAGMEIEKKIMIDGLRISWPDIHRATCGISQSMTEEHKAQFIQLMENQKHYDRESQVLLAQHFITLIENGYFDNQITPTNPALTMHANEAQSGENSLLMTLPGRKFAQLMEERKRK